MRRDDQITMIRAGAPRGKPRVINFMNGKYGIDPFAPLQGWQAATILPRQVRPRRHCGHL
nr:hypothetical protein [Bradyrhizobium sp. SEMIA]